MIPYRMQAGDARDLSFLGLPSESVDCIITSPPYWHLKKYGADDREIGHQQSKEEYLESLGEVFAESYALAKPTGVMWVVIDTIRETQRHGGLGEVFPLPFELITEARAAQWRVQDIAIWQKNKTLPYSGVGKLRNLMEYILFFTKSGEFKHRAFRCATRHRPGAEWLAGWPERYHPLGKRPANIWSYDIDTQGMWDHSPGLHACPFPQDLVARFIDLTTDKGDVVLDPFAGVGTVPAQAAAMGRQGIGVELNTANVTAFEKKVLPAFQASWERNAPERALQRQDQLEEATLILTLRLLKAGKELLRTLNRLATSSSPDHPAADVDSVLVPKPGDLGRFIHVDEGMVDRVPTRLLLICDLNGERRERLLSELAEHLERPPFTTFGLELTIETCSWSQLPRRGISQEEVLEFAQSRHGAYTQEMRMTLPGASTRLLTTLRLRTAVHGTKITPIQEAKLAAERRLLQSELATGDRHAEIASRLGIPGSDLRKLLLDHGLMESTPSFGFSLPDQLALD